jgi:hypothetical protein
MTAEKRITACKALLDMKRAFPHKQAKYQKDRTARFEKTDVDESSSNSDESQVENPSDYDGFGNIRNEAHDLSLPHVLPSIADTKSSMNNMCFTSRHSDYKNRRPAQVTSSEDSSSSEESQQQLWYSPLTSHPTEEMNPATPMVLVKRAPKALPSKQSIPIRPSPPKHHSPMSQAPVLFRPVLIPAALTPINARSSQAPVVRDPNRYILVRARNYEKMSYAVLQQALQLIQAPANIRTKPKALQYLKSYFLAVRDRSHVIYVEKYKLVSAALVCD